MMKSRKDIVLVLFSGGMVLSCFDACTSFVLACISQKPVPLPEAAVILLGAGIITAIHNRRAWRRIYVTILHLTGFLLSCLWLCHGYYRLEFPFPALNRVLQFFLLERAATDWLTLIFILLCAGTLWLCGARLWIKPADRTTLSHRFDLGLAFLLFLLLIKLLIVVKGGLIPMEHSSTGSLPVFMILGLFSMGLVRMKGTSRAGSGAYFRGAGIILGFTLIAFMAGGGLFILFLPGLQTFADTGRDLFGTVIRPVERILIVLCRVFFESGVRRQFGKAQGGNALPVINRSGETGFGIFHYLLAGFTMAMLLGMAGFIIYRLFKWLLSKIKRLFSKVPEEKDNKGPWEFFLLLLCSAINFFGAVRVKIFHNPDAPCMAEKFYRRLLRWGRFSGLRHVVTETPKEYGIRLENRFPGVKKEIRYIIHMHDKAVYGCIFPDSRQISRARLALRKIHNPFLWFARIKFFLHNP